MSRLGRVLWMWGLHSKRGCIRLMLMGRVKILIAVAAPCGGVRDVDTTTAASIHACWGRVHGWMGIEVWWRILVWEWV